ncbi:maltose excess protein 1, chloroplastic isoform X2 [Hevea brasiliensis]|uniref:maltose excess protein 1, chloroplastic isoform X2 n=1 Tax=Hevea brasiliensis TaxID=3981 RepID=UPI0025DF02B5|nr:maltose excess protein 1, chloroplastic isoform X2 [Hevea brasiliensis]
MARSLVVPLASTAPSKHSSLFPNFPFHFHSHSIPSRTLSLAIHKPSNCYTHYSLTSLHRRLSPVPALDSDVPHPLQEGSANVKGSKSFEQWDSWTAKFSGASNIPFLLLQMPQIILNAQNLMAGNKTALFAVPWLGMFTGLLGNLSLLSYFVKKKETEVIVVQTLGVVSIYLVITQLAMAEAMPLPHFLATSVVVATGLVLNFFNFLGKLNAGIWRVWEDFITVAGLSALPQVMWSTFVPYIPSTILPGAIAFVTAVAAVIMARTGKLSEKGVKFVGGISGWTATLLFMWMPVSQMWTNFLNPDNIKGLSAFSMLLAVIGNGLMVPRALFIRDFMWGQSNPVDGNIMGISVLEFPKTMSSLGHPGLHSFMGMGIFYACTVSTVSAENSFLQPLLVWFYG